MVLSVIDTAIFPNVPGQGWRRHSLPGLEPVYQLPNAEMMLQNPGPRNSDIDKMTCQLVKSCAIDFALQRFSALHHVAGARRSSGDWR
jgi:hypothetical protein